MPRCATPATATLAQLKDGNVASPRFGSVLRMHEYSHACLLRYQEFIESGQSE